MTFSRPFHILSQFEADGQPIFRTGLQKRPDKRDIDGLALLRSNIKLWQITLPNHSTVLHQFPGTVEITYIGEQKFIFDTDLAISNIYLTDLNIFIYVFYF